MEDPLLELKTPTLFVIGSHSTLTSQEEVEVHLHVNPIASPLLFCTVDSPLFSREIVESGRFALRAAVLHKCQNYFGSYTVENEIAIINGKRRNISTIARQNRGL